MIVWTLVFFICSVLLALLAYRKEKNATTYIAKLLFFICLLCFLFLLVSSALRSGPPPLREPTPISLRLAPHINLPNIDDVAVLRDVETVV